VRDKISADVKLYEARMLNFLHISQCMTRRQRDNGAARGLANVEKLNLSSAIEFSATKSFPFIQKSRQFTHFPRQVNSISLSINREINAITKSRVRVCLGYLRRAIRYKLAIIHSLTKKISHFSAKQVLEYD
jgi:hypothetical protein